jgi:D-sedoheptulose 7-phosphate isomerase
MPPSDPTVLAGPTALVDPPPADSTELVDHVDRLAAALPALRASSPTLASWGVTLAERLLDGGRLLAAGNGGSAAEAQHLTAELVGRFDRDRDPFSAIALHGDTSALTGIGNDYGYEDVYARQVRAHARPGDVVVLLSTSGRSPNMLAAAAEARRRGAHAWALTGPGPNPLAQCCTDAVCLPGDTATVQEAHLAALHMICRAVEAALPPPRRRAAPAPRRLVIPIRSQEDL